MTYTYISYAPYHNARKLHCYMSFQKNNCLLSFQFGVRTRDGGQVEVCTKAIVTHDNTNLLNFETAMRLNIIECGNVPFLRMQ